MEGKGSLGADGISGGPRAKSRGKVVTSRSKDKMKIRSSELSGILS